MTNLDCRETVLRRSQVSVVSFVSNVELVGDPVPNYEQHWRLKENKCLYPGEKPLLTSLYMCKSINCKKRLLVEHKGPWVLY